MIKEKDGESDRQIVNVTMYPWCNYNVQVNKFFKKYSLIITEGPIFEYYRERYPEFSDS
jgi:hypothetical protein